MHKGSDNDYRDVWFIYIYMYIKYVTFYLNKSKIFIKVLALKLYFRNNFCKWKKSRFFTDSLKDFTLLSTFTSSEEACVFLAGTRPYFLIIITIKLHLIHWVTQTLCEHKTLKKTPKAYESSRFQVGVSKGSAKVRTTYHLTGSC